MGCSCGPYRYRWNKFLRIWETVACKIGCPFYKETTPRKKLVFDATLTERSYDGERW